MTAAKPDEICKKMAILSAQQMHWMYDDEEKHHGESMSNGFFG
jgi:hypothetical protein